MRRRRPLVLTAAAIAAAAAVSAATASGATFSSDQRLPQKRYVAAGDRAYVVGTADGRFAPMGFHIKGEMGGVWAHPIKLLDGYWLSVDGLYVAGARRITTGPGYERFAFAPTQGIGVRRLEFSPDGSPVVLVATTLRNRGARARTVRLGVDAHSELMGAYPWGEVTPTNAAQANRRDVAAVDRQSGTLRFTEPGTGWAAVVGALGRPASMATGDAFFGPSTKKAQDTEFGRGQGGRLEWRVSVPAGGQRTLWFGVAGSTRSAGDANAVLARALAQPGRLLARKVAGRNALRAQTRVSLPDASLERAFDQGKLNMADLRRTVTDVRVRDVDEGTKAPKPVARIASLTGIGAGYPDYPWYFGTDGAYTAYPLLVSGQWDTALAQLRGVRDVSRAINGRTGKVVHEIVTDGSVYYGANAQPGNTNETAQFATAVEQLWRWTGDPKIRDEFYPFVRDGLRTVVTALDADRDAFPEGSGMVERPGMGAEKLDVTAYTWQALGALQRMAASRGDTATATFAASRRARIAAAFDGAWWLASAGQYADSRCNRGDTVPAAEAKKEGWINICPQPDSAGRLEQFHWIRATPFETGLAPAERAAVALGRLESPASSGPTGLFHTGRGGGPDRKGELKVWSLPNSVMAVAEATYGRLDGNGGGALKYMDLIASELDVEMPGALTEIAPSPQYDPFQPFTDRAMFMQAWSSYGIQWPVIHHFLGITPDVPAGRVEVVPDVPSTWPGLSVKDLRVGDGTLSASARAAGGRYATTATAPRGLALVLGHTLPAGTPVGAVTVDGKAVPADAVTVTDTTRGREVRVAPITTGGSHRLTVAAG